MSLKQNPEPQKIFFFNRKQSLHRDVHFEPSDSRFVLSSFHFPVVLVFPDNIVSSQHNKTRLDFQSFTKHIERAKSK